MADISKKDIFKYILLEENVYIPIQIPSQFMFLHIQLSISQHWF